MKRFFCLIFLLAAFQANAQTGWDKIVKMVYKDRNLKEGIMISKRAAQRNGVGKCKGLAGYNSMEGTSSNHVNLMGLFFSSKENAFVLLRAKGNSMFSAGPYNPYPYVSTRWKLKKGKVVKTIILIDSNKELEEKICASGYEEVYDRYEVNHPRARGTLTFEVVDDLNAVTKDILIDPTAKTTILKKMKEEVDAIGGGRRIMGPREFSNDSDMYRRRMY